MSKPKKKLGGNNHRRDTSKTSNRSHKKTSGKSISTKELQRILTQKASSQKNQVHPTLKPNDRVPEGGCDLGDLTSLSTYNFRYNEREFSLKIGGKSTFKQNLSVIPFRHTNRNSARKFLAGTGGRSA